VATFKLSTQTRTQVPSVKVNGEYYFPRFNEIHGDTVFKSAWEYDDNEWRPRIVKMANENERHVTLLLREKLSGNKLEDFHLANVKLWGTINGPHHSGVIVSRYSGVLSEFTSSFTPPPDLVLKHLNHISVALKTIHSIGMVHCDVKPSNIFLDGMCNAFLGDFGSMVPINDRVKSSTVCYCVKEHLANYPQTALPLLDWTSLIITGLQLLRKIVIKEDPVSFVALGDWVERLRSDTEAAHVKIVEIFDTNIAGK
jgi:serine/threonine protein kinase